MKYLIPSLITLGITQHGLAAPTDKCTEIKSCVELVSELTGKKYVFDKDLKGSVSLSKKYKITKENADNFLGYQLQLSGYTRLPIANNEWAIINSRDIRYHPTPIYQYGKDTIPKTWDYITVHIKLENPYLASEVSRNFRPFMSRYGRIIDLKKPGMIIINDNGRNIHRLIELIKKIDKKPTEEEISNYQSHRKHQEKLALVRTKNCADIKSDLEEVKRLIVKNK